MKKIKIILFTLTIMFLGIINVYAKDTVYSINKYDDEKLMFIKDSYNKENKKDGNITVGTFLKETLEQDDEEYDNYQIMLIKYKTSGKIDWTYRYGKTSSEDINELVYIYNDDNNIDGYLMIISNSYNIEENNPKSLFVKIDLDGKLVYEKETNLNSEEIIKKLIPTYSIDNIVDGYIGITDTSIIKYDKNLNLVYKKDITSNTKYIDIIDINNENEIIGYAFIIEEVIENNKTNIKLITYNKDLTEIKTIKENIELENIKLANSNNGFIIYGITNEVKLKKSDRSYYLSKYNTSLEEEWESIGNIPFNKESNIILKSIKSNDTNKYFLLYKNIDNSYEVIKLDEEGLLKKKIKKINNNYYNFINFSISNKEKELYFIGQIKCPEDDNCDYDSNSLFLISDEDKVIEVEDTTSTNILLCVFILIIGIGALIYLIKSKSIKNKKK